MDDLRHLQQINLPLSAHDNNSHDRLNPSESETMMGWLREDVASGKLSPEAGAKAFEQLGVPVQLPAERDAGDPKVWKDVFGRLGMPEADNRSAEQQQLDKHFPAAKKEDYIIQYDTPGAPPMDPMQQHNLKQFDQTARAWLSHAGFPREIGNGLVNQIARVVEKTTGMNESQLEAYGQAEFTKLEQAYGKDLDAKLQTAARMIDELDKKTPGLKNLLKTKGIGDNAMVVNMLIDQARRWEIRNRR